MKTDFKVIHINKKGKIRKLVTYNNDEVRKKHELIKAYLEENLIFSIFTKAYRKNSSIYLNAKAHMYNDIFFKYDIKNFFDNIDHKILVRILYTELKKNNDVTLFDVANLIGECVVSSKGLPQGLITSPILSNIYLKEFDNILYGILKKKKFKNVIYTRYADDITISFKGEYDNFQSKEINSELISEIDSLLKRYKLALNKNKISIINLNVSNHVRITGINITKIKSKDCSRELRKLSVGKKRIFSLYDDAMRMYVFLTSEENYLPTDQDRYTIQKIKGLNSFILSVHKTGYENMLSPAMLNKLKDLGFESLNELINALVVE